MKFCYPKNINLEISTDFFFEQATTSLKVWCLLKLKGLK